MALEIAIGELQKYAGHDQRVTARADLLEPRPSLPPIFNQGQLYTFWNDSRNPFWTGVWNTNFDSISQDYPVWLVSGNEHVDTTTNPFGPFPDFRFPDFDNPSFFTPDMQFDALGENLGQAVLLVGPGTAAFGVGVDRFDGRVMVPKQPILVDRYPGLSPSGAVAQGPYDPSVPYANLDGHRIGHYAYWVGDEGVKLNLTAAGLRFPLDEWERKSTGPPYGSDFSSFRPPLPYEFREDELAANLSPARFGFEVLRDEFLVDGENIAEDFNPLVRRWHDVSVPSHASMVTDFAGNTPSGFGGSDLVELYHDLTTYSHGVLANTNEGRLKVDFTRDPTLLNNINPDYGNYVSYAGAETRFDDINDFNRGYPLAIIGRLDEHNVGRPVVTHLRFDARLVSQGEDAPVALSVKPLLGIWNPYTADLSWADGTSGYDFRVRFSYDETENAGNPFFLRLGAGLVWEIPPPEDSEEPTRFHYSSWFSDVDIDLFNLGSTPSMLEFPVTGNTVLRSGEIAFFREVTSGGDILRGGDDSQYMDLTVPGLALDVEALRPEPNAFLFDARPTLYLSTFGDWESGNGIAQPEITLEVEAIPAGETSGVVVHTQAINLEVFRDVQASPDAQPSYGSEPGAPGSPDPGGTVRAQWAESWSTTASDDTRIVPSGPGGVSGVNFSGPGSMISFSWGMGTNGHIMDQSYHQRTEFYGWYESTPNRPSFPTWGGNDEFGYGRQQNTSLGIPTSRFSVLRDLPRYEPGLIGSIPTGRIPVMSVAQLRHASTGGIPSSLYDLGFFSTMVEVPATSADPLLLWNPRLKPFSDGVLVETRLRGNAAFGGVDDDALDNYQDADRAAANLMVEGAFNVNSTSVAAWAALLNSFAMKPITVWDPDNNEFALLEPDPNNPNDLNWPARPDSQFSTFPHSPGASFYGRENVSGGDVHRRSIWRNGFRQLRPLDLSEGVLNNPDTFTPTFRIEYRSPYNPTGPWYSNAAMAMAEIIVHRIREIIDSDSSGPHLEARPFYSMEEFVESGILQYAIENVRWRDDTVEQNDLNWYFNDSNIWPGGSNQWETIPNNSPSYLSQENILSALGSVLTTRSDTFIIRTYGDAFNPVTNQVEARAYLEAVVQRVPTPVVPDPGETSPAVNPDPNSLHGRKFEVISFRWLSPNEI